MAVQRYKAVGTITTMDFKTIKNGDYVYGEQKIETSGGGSLPDTILFNGYLDQMGKNKVSFRYNNGRGSTFRLEKADFIPAPRNQAFGGIAGGIYNIDPSTGAIKEVGGSVPLKLQAGNQSKFKEWQDKNRYSIAGFVILGIVIAIVGFIYWKFIKK
jgi:hypothetical protein